MSTMTDQELIEQVATEVMGWYISDKLYFDSKEQIAIGFATEAEEILCVFNPLINVNHAFMVVKRMKELGYKLELKQYGNYEYKCNFWKDGFVYSADNVFIGHAICLAALEVMRANKEVIGRE